MHSIKSFVCLALAAAHVGVAQDPNASNAKSNGMPDLSALAKNFPKDKDSDSPVLNITIAAGPYTVAIKEDAAFPNRTLYVPEKVPAGVKVPLFAWENGMCYKFGLMYYDFLGELASHGYFIVAPGAPRAVGPGSTTRAFQTQTIDLALKWQGAPFALDTTKIVAGGHSCGGIETFANLAEDRGKRITTALLLNTGTTPAVARNVTVPTLWIHGGPKDVAYSSEALFQTYIKEKPTIPAFKAVLDTGHLGSFYSPRGGIYAETSLHWMNWQLKGNNDAKNFFVGGQDSPAAKRGWKVQSSGI